jgi:hypothetical protein
MRQKELLAKVLWDVGRWRGNVSIKPERRFGRNLVESIWQIVVEDLTHETEGIIGESVVVCR